MKITNIHKLPEALVAFARNDKYSKGDADISVTTLIDSPRIRILRSLNSDKMTSDVTDTIWPLLGTAVHSMLEASSDDENALIEERLFKEYNGWTLSGAIDHQQIDVDSSVEITDYKVTSAWSVIFGKIEWELQQNVYAQLVRDTTGREVTAIRICVILRDWMRRKAEMDPNYPATPIVLIDLPLWSENDAKGYILDRIELHQKADVLNDMSGEMPKCSDEDRWLRGEAWAVKKTNADGKPAKRAAKVCESEDEAKRWIGDRLGFSIEFRPGEAVRCKGDYCGVAEFCQQYQEAKE